MERRGDLHKQIEARRCLASIFFVVLADLKTNPLRLRLRTEASARMERITPQRKRITAADRRRIVDLYAKGMSTRQVGDEMSLAKSTVLRILKAEGVELRPQGNYPGRG